MKGTKVDYKQLAATCKRIIAAGRGFALLAEAICLTALAIKQFGELSLYYYKSKEHERRQRYLRRVSNRQRLYEKRKAAR